MKLELREKAASIVAEKLEERFGDEFVFDPIMVIPKIDDYGEDYFPYLDIYVVFDGDQANLDPSWTAGMAGRLIPQLMELGVDEFPVTGFVAKSEWKWMGRRVQHELERKLERAAA